MGMDIVIRLDPVLVHLFQALYGDSWFEKVAGLVDVFAAIGARHVTASTGRLSRKRSPSAGREGTSTLRRVYNVIYGQSPLAAEKFEQGAFHRRE